jgi:hypothetical protein
MDESFPNPIHIETNPHIFPGPHPEAKKHGLHIALNACNICTLGKKSITDISFIKEFSSDSRFYMP